MSRSRASRPAVIAVSDGALRNRARRLRDKGDLRGALVALREACLRDERDAAGWTIYGVLLAARGRVEEAQTALKHAVWLRKGSGDEARAKSTVAVLAKLRPVAA